MPSLLPRAFALALMLLVAAPAAALADPVTGGVAPVSARAATVPGPTATVDRFGLAHPPKAAPARVKRAIWAGNEIQRKPYVWGGGHASWKARGYDCSGTVSYVLHAAGILNTPLVSGAFARFGARGKGKWITIYANGGHAFVYLAGLRLDTSGTGGSGPRWRLEPRRKRGFTVRHPRGL